MRHPEVDESVFPSGSRAQKLWALLRNPKQQFESLCWLSRCLLLKNRCAVSKHFPEPGAGSCGDGAF